MAGALAVVSAGVGADGAKVSENTVHVAEETASIDHVAAVKVSSGPVAAEMVNRACARIGDVENNPCGTARESESSVSVTNSDLAWEESNADCGLEGCTFHDEDFGMGCVNSVESHTAIWSACEAIVCEAAAAVNGIDEPVTSTDDEGGERERDDDRDGRRLGGDDRRFDGGLRDRL